MPELVLRTSTGEGEPKAFLEPEVSEGVVVVTERPVSDANGGLVIATVPTKLLAQGFFFTLPPEALAWLRVYGDELKVVSTDGVQISNVSKLLDTKSGQVRVTDSRSVQFPLTVRLQAGGQSLEIQVQVRDAR